LLTANDIGNEARERMKVMTSTNDGFLIAEKDLELRGPGDIEGTRQSGELNFRLASIVKDRPILDAAKEVVQKILEEDPDLAATENSPVKNFLTRQKTGTVWSRIS
jgi:ATP-dependent DNA helicase RecG